MPDPPSSTKPRRAELPDTGVVFEPSHDPLPDTDLGGSRNFFTYRLPSLPLVGFVHSFWFYKRSAPVHARERALLTETVELVVDRGNDTQSNHLGASDCVSSSGPTLGGVKIGRKRTTADLSRLHLLSKAGA